MKNSVLIAKNEDRWSNVRFDLSASKKAASVAKRLVKAKDAYLSIANKTGVPWYVIAVIHEREASQAWDRNIAQGDPWNKVSTHVPKGRGPFNSFYDAAYDALVNCAPYASKWSDWSAGGTLTLLELYNGLGYENRGIASPYIWSGTNQYDSGKYIADGVFDAATVDPQLGCAVLIDAIHTIDHTVVLGTSTTKKPPSVPTKPTDVQTQPKGGPVGDTTDTKPGSQSTTIISSIIGILTALGAGAWQAFEKAFADWRIVLILVLATLYGVILYKRSSKPDIKGIFT